MSWSVSKVGSKLYALKQTGEVSAHHVRVHSLVHSSPDEPIDGQTEFALFVARQVEEYHITPGIGAEEAARITVSWSDRKGNPQPDWTSTL